jgi:hypothetical protein
MDQLELRLMSRIDAPSVVPVDAVARIKTYRAAVIACWLYRRIKGMTNASLCEQTGMRPSHVSEYFNPCETDKRGRELRDMPAKYIPALERAAGNTFVSQWLAAQSELPIDVDSILASGKAA